MKQYQVKQMLRQGAMLLANSLFLLLFCLIFSCKTTEQKRRTTNQYIINNLLDYYVQKYDTIYLSDKRVEIENPNVIFNNINLNEKLPNSCAEIVNDSIGAKPYPLKTEDYLNYDNFKYNVTNSKVYTNDKIEIKDSKNINNFKIDEQNLRSGKTELYDNLLNDIALIKYLHWNKENSIPVLLLSKPVVSSKNKLAAVYVSRIKEGDFLWFLKKEKKKWVVFCEKRLNYH